MNHLFKPRRVAVRLEERLIAEFIYYWIMYEKPCKLTIQPAKTPGLVGISFTINNNNILEFKEKVVSKTGGVLFELD